MVVLSPQDALVLIVLLACVPIQMWLQHHHMNGVSSDMRDGRVFAFLRDAHKSFNKFISPTYWYNTLIFALLSDNYPDDVIREYALQSFQEVMEDKVGECPAVEVFRMKQPDGYYATGVEPRKYRTRMVQYRVGQVVRHKVHGVRGVIIGWDETCKAPSSFLSNNYGGDRMIEIVEMPNYAVLVDTRDYPEPISMYYAQKDLELVTDSTKVQHTALRIYFDDFDGSRHLPKKWLAAIYPED